MVRHNEKKSRAWQQNFAPKKWAFQSVKKVAVLNEVFIQSPALACRNHFWRSIVKPRPFGFFQSSDRPLYSKSMEMVLLLADTLVLQLTDFFIKYSNYNTVVCIFVQIKLSSRSIVQKCYLIWKPWWFPLRRTQ